MSTGDAARELGISEPYLQALIRRGKVAAPPKTRGKRKWSPTWIEKAKASLARYS